MNIYTTSQVKRCTSLNSGEANLNDMPGAIWVGLGFVSMFWVLFGCVLVGFFIVNSIPPPLKSFLGHLSPAAQYY